MRSNETLKACLNFSPKIECLMANQLLIFELLVDIRTILVGSSPDRRVPIRPEEIPPNIKTRPGFNEAAFKKKAEEARKVLDLDKAPGKTEDYL
jgi:hypothetical protein